MSNIKKWQIILSVKFGITERRAKQAKKLIIISA